MRWSIAQRVPASAVSAIPFSRVTSTQRRGSSGRICFPSNNSGCSAISAWSSDPRSRTPLLPAAQGHSFLILRRYVRPSAGHLLRPRLHRFTSAAAETGDSSGTAPIEVRSSCRPRASRANRLSTSSPSDQLVESGRSETGTQAQPVRLRAVRCRPRLLLSAPQSLARAGRRPDSATIPLRRFSSISTAMSSSMVSVMRITTPYQDGR